MYGVNTSDAISRDMNSLLYSSTFKHPADGEFAKIKQLISPDPYLNYDCQNQYQNQQEDDCYEENQISLLRYRSTPSSFFSNLLREEFPDPITDSSVEEKFLMTHQPQKHKESESDAGNYIQYTPTSTAMEHKKHSSPVKMNDLPSKNSSSYGYTNRSNLDSVSTNLVRQNSSPAGFISSYAADNGFATIKKGGSSSSSPLNNHASLSSGTSSSPSRFLPQIAENSNRLQDSTFSSLKRSRDGVLKMSQNGETANHTSNLVHHMSLPKTSSEMEVVENFLQFQQESTVRCKTRAKRGFATHPRSIAERVRRTRISERIKRLQDLFPNIDKQSNTADMLDMAVEYIKNLQKELQTLNDAKARCKCSSKQ